MDFWVALTLSVSYHGWPSTQPNRNTHNLAAHHRAAHNPAARRFAGSVVCNLPRWPCRLAQRWFYCPDVGPTLAQPTLLSDWLTCEESYRVTHTTEPAHHRAARLCAARWCAARLCVIRLGCVEGHPWLCSVDFVFGGKIDFLTMRSYRWVSARKT